MSLDLALSWEGHRDLRRNGDAGRSRFWSKVARGEPSACWPWIAGRRHRGGYGAFWIGKTHLGSHVIAYLLSGGKLTPEKPHVLHRCDNPPCCNPSHLWAGTQFENNRDMASKGRSNAPRGEKHHSAKLSPGDVSEIRSLRGQLSERVLAARFGVTKPAIHQLLNGRTWKVR